jgi:hypothetical protein
MLNNFTPHTQVVAIKIVGYTNLNLLGKRQSLTVYANKEDLIESENKSIEQKRSFYKKAKTFVSDFALMMHGEILKAKVWAAKKSLRVKGYCWSRYIDLCNAFRLLHLFNNSVCFDLRVKL